MLYPLLPANVGDVCSRAALETIVVRSIFGARKGEVSGNHSDEEGEEVEECGGHLQEEGHSDALLKRGGCSRY